MGRRNRRADGSGRPLSTGSVRCREEHADGGWLVATRPARHDGTHYTCPICGNRLAGSQAHLVVWPEDGSVADRRHVHRTCWQRRATQRDPVRW